MEHVLVYKACDDKRQSIEETLRDNGYVTVFADNILDFIKHTGEGNITRVCICIDDFSDVRLLHTIGKINKKINIILLVEKDIQDIVELYRNTNYTLLANVKIRKDEEPKLEKTPNNGLAEKELDIAH